MIIFIQSDYDIKPDFIQNSAVMIASLLIMSL